MKKLSGKQLLAYVAGIIDGEGSISIIHSNDKKYAKGYHNVMEVRVCNSKEWLCQFLKFNFGGNIGVMSGSSSKIRSGPIYYWEIHTKSAKEFLIQVLPYLQLKRPQAELAIEFQKGKHPINRKRVKTDEEWALEEAQRIVMRSYNSPSGKKKILGVED